MDAIGDRALPRLPTVIIVVLVAFIAAGIDVALRQETPGTPARPAADLPAAAASWVAREVSSARPVGCDPRTCGALRSAGVRTTTPAKAAIVVTTTPSTATPDVLAAFGSGAGRIEVRTTAPSASDRRARSGVGAELLHNPHLTIAPAARAALSEARVDARILGVLGALAAEHTVSVAGFGPPAPGAGPGTELRVVEIDRVDGAPVTTVPRFLAAQPAALRPSDTALAGGILRLHYRVDFLGTK